MTNLSVSIKSANVTDATKITSYLYELVESEKIASFRINKITKGANSIDVSTLIPLLESIDINEIYQKGVDGGIFHLAGAFIALKIAKELTSTVSDMIDVAEKLKSRSKIGIKCKVGGSTVSKMGRAFGVEPFDTVLVSATPESLESQFLAQRQWGEITVSKDRYFGIKYVAIFVKSPAREIQWIGKVSRITYNPKNKKSTLFLDGMPEKIRPIPYDSKCPHNNAHGVSYTTISRIRNAKTLCDVYPSLSQM